MREFWGRDYILNKVRLYDPILLVQLATFFGQNKFNQYD